MNTITRKIQINPLGETKEERNEIWKTLRHWNDLIFRSANRISTHMYWQDRQKEFLYLNKNADSVKEANAQFKEMIECSEQNTTYRLLSEDLKGTVPSSIFNTLNSVIKKTFDKEKKEYFTGKRSLRSYKKGIPMPFSSKSIRNINQEEKDFTFDLFGFRFKTFFGRDLSGNRLIFERAVNVEYKLCDSSIKIEDTKMFLLAVFQFESEKPELKEDKEMNAILSVINPIEYELKGKTYNIGTKEEFLHRRLQIQNSLRNSQINAKYSSGGKGRKKKMKSIDRYEKLEKNYVQTKLHTYSRILIDACVNNGCGKLILIDQLEKEEEAKNNAPILRNWSYYGLKQMIDYKAKREGITVIVR